MSRQLAAAFLASVAVNGGFENGTLSGWTVTSFTNLGITVPPRSEADLHLAAGGTATSSAVTSLPGLGTLNEPGATAPLHVPLFGSWAALVNGQSSGFFGHAGNVNKLSQSYTVTAADVDPSDGQIHVRLVMAPILEDGGHAAGQQPYVYVQAANTTRRTIIGTDFTSAGQAGMDWLHTGSSITGQPVDYTGWRLVDFAPGNAALQPGDTVAIDIIAAGCSAESSHVGEVLVDSVGPFVPGLSVSSTAVAQVNANADIVYSHAVHGGGVLVNTDVTVTQPIIAGTSFVSVNAPVTATCSTPAAGATSGKVVCNLGTVNPAATANLKVTLKAPATTGTLINANVTVSADGGAFLNANKVESDIVSEVRFADVKLAIADGIAALEWGGSATYDISVTNAGPSAANAVTLNLPLPLNVLDASWSCAPTAGGPSIISVSPPGAGPMVAIFGMPANSSATCSYTANVVPGSGPGTLTLSGTALDLTTVNPNPADGAAADQDGLSGSLIEVTVSTDAAGKGHGVVVSAPAQIDCGSACTGHFAPGVPIALTATGTPGSRFTGWSGSACDGSELPLCTFTPGADTIVTARFDKLTFPITTNVTGPGTVTCPAVAVQGSTVLCAVTLAGGFQLASLTDNGADVTGQIALGQYTEINVQIAHSLNAVFAGLNGIACRGGNQCAPGSSCIAGACIASQPIATLTGTGCSSGGGILPLLGLVMFALLRVHNSRSKKAVLRARRRSILDKVESSAAKSARQQRTVGREPVPLRLSTNDGSGAAGLLTPGSPAASVLPAMTASVMVRSCPTHCRPWESFTPQSASSR